MKKSLGTFLIVVAVLVLARITEPAKAIEDMILGALLAAVGLVLLREKPSRYIELDEVESELLWLKNGSNESITIGIVTMLIGSRITRFGPEALLVGIAISLVGCAALVWGCVNYARWKGYTGWLGLFGYLMLPGLLVMAFLPSRRIRLALRDGSTESLADLRIRPRYLITLAPVVIGLACVPLLSPRSIAASEWQDVAEPVHGFRVSMPGVPKQRHESQESPFGPIELNRFSVKPAGKEELFMVTEIQIPDALREQFEGTKEILDASQADLLSIGRSTLKRQHEIALGGVPGRELEILPAQGAIVKARIFAVRKRVFQVVVHVPKIRLASADVDRFFESFQISDLESDDNR